MWPAYVSPRQSRSPYHTGCTLPSRTIHAPPREDLRRVLPTVRESQCFECRILGGDSSLPAEGEGSASTLAMT